MKNYSNHINFSNITLRLVEYNDKATIEIICLSVFEYMERIVIDIFTGNVSLVLTNRNFLVVNKKRNLRIL
jgi:hypothetical protein